MAETQVKKPNPVAKKEDLQTSEPKVQKKDSQHLDQKVEVNPRKDKNADVLPRDPKGFNEKDRQDDEKKTINVEPDKSQAVGLDQKNGDVLPPDPKTLHKTDPQENMKGPVSSLVQDAKKEIEEGDKESKQDADKKKDENM